MIGRDEMRKTLELEKDSAPRRKGRRREIMSNGKKNEEWEV